MDVQIKHSYADFPLDVVFADDLSADILIPDELIEGILIAGEMSLLYGDSNCGKTYFAVEMACSIARGIDWLDRKTEPGMVVYLATESPASIQRRLQAYQKHHGVVVENFVIVKSPINLFSDDADTDLIVRLVKMLEEKYQVKVRFIIGDTLARLIPGANESTAQDMGQVIQRCDNIRKRCNSHLMLIHHRGKNPEAGARGWSGLRAAVDTEIEVTDTPAGRSAEIKKQRDLGSKGLRIGFKLEVVSLGVNKWNSPITSCVVVPAEAPLKTNTRRVSVIRGDILEYLQSAKQSIQKCELVKYFEGKYVPSAIYRQIQQLVKEGKISDGSGYITLVPISAN